MNKQHGRPSRKREYKTFWERITWTERIMFVLMHLMLSFVIAPRELINELVSMFIDMGINPGLGKFIGLILFVIVMVLFTITVINFYDLSKKGQESVIDELMYELSQREEVLLKEQKQELLQKRQKEKTFWKRMTGGDRFIFVTCCASAVMGWMFASIVTATFVFVAFETNKNIPLWQAVVPSLAIGLPTVVLSTLGIINLYKEYQEKDVS